MTASELAELARGLGGRYRVELFRLQARSLSPERGRLALCMLLLGTDALPAGGELILSETPQGGLRVEGKGSRAGWRLGGDPAALDLSVVTPEHLVTYACSVFAEAAGLTLATTPTIAGEPPTIRIDTVPKAPV